MQTLQGLFHTTQEYLESLFSDEPKFSRESGYWTSEEDEKKDGFFDQLVSTKSQRENWYTLTQYVAEPLCAISNAGFFYVGLKHNCPELLFAGTASVISHSIPKKWLLTVDKIGVLIVLSKFIFEIETIKETPWLVLPLVTAAGINVADVYLARRKGYTWPHVAWHLSAAALADIFLTRVLDKRPYQQSKGVVV